MSIVSSRIDFVDTIINNTQLWALILNNFDKNTVVEFLSKSNYQHDVIYLLNFSDRDVDRDLDQSIIYVDDENKLSFIYSIMLQNYNVVFVDVTYNIANAIISDADFTNEFYSDIYYSHHISTPKILYDVYDKFNLKLIINSSFMIISNKYLDLITTTLSIYNKLHSTPHTTNIALSMANSQHNYLIKPLTNIVSDHHLSSDTYIYYPFLDNNDIAIDHNQNIDAIAINTLRNTYNAISFGNMYKNFEVPNHGIYIKKPNLQLDQREILSQILHVITDNDNNDNLRMNLRLPWKYMLWNTDALNDLMQGRWLNMYQNASCEKIRRIIIICAITESFGGLVIFDNIKLVKNLPWYLFEYPIVGVFDGPQFNELLSTNIMGFACGNRLAPDDIPIPSDPARRPFMGQNSFYIENRLRRENGIIRPDNQIINKNQIVFDAIYKLLSDGVDFPTVSNYIVSLSNIFVYPYHVFHRQRYLSKYSYGYVVEKIESNLASDIPDNNLIRTYRLNNQAIIHKLHQNPLDLLKSKKII